MASWVPCLSIGHRSTDTMKYRATRPPPMQSNTRKKGVGGGGRVGWPNVVLHHGAVVGVVRRVDGAVVHRKRRK